MSAPALRARTGWLALAAIAACTASTQREQEAARDVEAAQRLVGVWDVTLSTERATATNSVTRPVQARGSFAFVEGAGAPSSRLLGMSDVDIRPHALSPLATAIPLTAEVHRAADTGTDSLFVLIDQGEAGYEVRLAGTVDGDSASGSWIAESHSVAGGGRFWMRRHRS